jgi:WD40 repeat protein
MRQYLRPQPNTHLRLVRTLTGHQSVVRSIAWSPDETALVAGGKDGQILHWRLDCPDEGHLLGRHAGWSTAVAWHPRAPLVLSGASDGQIFGWDPAAATQRWARSLHRSRVTALTCALAEGQFVSADASGTILVSAVDDGQVLLRLTGHAGAVTDLAVHPSAPWLASIGDDMSLRIWGLETGAPLGLVRDHSWYGSAVAWSADGRLLASGGLDETVQLYSGDSFAPLATIGHFPDWVRCLRWHPRGPLLACGCKDGRLWLWDMAERRCLSTVEAHAASIVALAWSGDGALLASASEDATVRLWERAC